MLRINVSVLTLYSGLWRSFQIHEFIRWDAEVERIVFIQMSFRVFLLLGSKLYLIDWELTNRNFESTSLEEENIFFILP